MKNLNSIEVGQLNTLLEEAYHKVLQTHMLGLPILNSYLNIEAVGFAPFKNLWLGILITPWFMNLMLLSRAETCPVLSEGKSQLWAFPSGNLKFNGDFEAEIGAFQTCTLFSPMHEFSSQEEARSAAQTIIKNVFIEVVRTEAELEQKPSAGPLAEIRAVVAEPMTKRDFLRGSFLPSMKR